MSSGEPPWRLAPAKVNLFLHVGPPGADGYHPLVSLAVFADVGDRVAVTRADAFRLETRGSFAAHIDGGPNLIETALDAMARAVGLDRLPAHVRLDKRLPVAAGLGGGSSDAATAMKAARDVLGLDLDDAALTRIAGPLGADMAMCLAARAVIARGRGEVLGPAPSLPQLHAVLLNPGVPSSTAAVYRAYDEAPREAANAPDAPSGFGSVAELADWLTSTRNDLQAPAVRLTPLIGKALEAAASAPGALTARVTGSGATVFALFGTAEAARRAADALSQAHPDWWAMSCRLA
ncbi:MAG: 4-(cytidine 5'-diphospho)-2-C-methyl-D-erythritol kinase [Brevundimonas sp.]|uniref:4-(cytidine 5'-diphospho)-2-C-methyl-D-erythritol kinase n=1 Tax=Brevundimonas sp. TaxID=1871086 RepID=UPI00391A3FE8